MDNFDSNDSHDDLTGPASLPTALPAPPRMPNFVPQIIPVSITGRRISLVASNPNPMQTRATVPALRLVRGRPSVPPPSIPPTGSTPIRRAA